MQTAALPSPAMPSHYWADWASPALAQALAQLQAQARAEAAVAVLPIAAIEQHGPHLPLSVDSDIGMAFVQASLPHLAQAPIWFLPLQMVGLSTEHTSYAGTLHAQPATLLAQWHDVAASVARTGVRKLVLLNSHGGNSGLMEVAARQIRASLNMAVWHSSWFHLPFSVGTQQLFGAQEERFGVHGGEHETALMLAIAPHKVDMAKAQHFDSSAQQRAADYAIMGNGKSAKLGWLMQDYNPQGAAGNALAATAEKGQALLAEGGALLAALLREISAVPLAQVLGTPAQS